MPDHQEVLQRFTPAPPRPARRLGAALMREPFLVFLAVAALLFGLYRLTAGAPEKIEVSAAAQRSLADDYMMMTGHPPDAGARAKLVRDYVTDEILFREAVRRGLHATDKASRQRLIDRLRFMISGAPDEPGEETLVNYYSEHMPLYRSEPQTSLTHVFFQKPPADPAKILATLNAGGTVKGDDFWMGHDLPDYGESMLRGMFGPDFLKRLDKAPAGRWIGPLPSTRGTHFVKVFGRAKPSLLPYPAVRDQVRQDYLAATSGKLVDAEVEKLEKGYDVDVER